MAEVTPRVNAPYLQTFTGQTVRVLGKVVQLRGETAVVDAGGQINVLLMRVSFFPSRFREEGGWARLWISRVECILLEVVYVVEWLVGWAGIGADWRLVDS